MSYLCYHITLGSLMTHIWISKLGHHWFRKWLTVYPKKYTHGFVVLCFVVVMQSFIMNSHEVFVHIHQGCFAGTGCQWSKPDGYGKISQCITTTKHSKAKTVCIFLGIYRTTCVVTNHHLNQCWFIVSWILENNFVWNHFNQNTITFIEENTFESIFRPES